MQNAYCFEEAGGSGLVEPKKITARLVFLVNFEFYEVAF